MQPEIPRLPKDVLGLIFKTPNLDIGTILSLCKTSKFFANLCRAQNEELWRLLFIKFYGDFYDNFYVERLNGLVIRDIPWKTLVLVAYNNILMNSPDFINVYSFVNELFHNTNRHIPYFL